MRWFFRLLAISFGLPLLCMVTGAVLFTTFVTQTIAQLPAWAQGPVTAWMLGTPQPAGGAAGTPGGDFAPAGVGVGWDGYVDPFDTNPPNGLPLEGTVYITCLFHDPFYPSHTGVDLTLWPETTLGAPVYTTMAGKVIWAGWNGPWGNLVVIENNGYQVWFAHLVSIVVTSGQIVQYGEIVGTVGSTGNSTGPHLHYGIKMLTGDGGQVWVNPINYFGGEPYGKAPCE